MSSDSKPGFFARLRARLTRPGAGLGSELARLFGTRRIDAEVLEELETRLLAADVGVTVTQELREGSMRSGCATGRSKAVMSACSASSSAATSPSCWRATRARKPSSNS